MSAEKYKVGDRVVVKSLDWYNENKNKCGDVRVPCCFVSGMAAFCGVNVTIASKNKNAWCDSYYIKEDGGRYSWSDEMFEGLSNEGYAFTLTKDVKDLPKTYAECTKIVGANEGLLICPSDVRVIRFLTSHMS